MGWTPLYMDMQNKNVLVVGSGEVGERRARRFLKSGANVVINSDHVSDQLKELGAIYKPRKELSKWADWADLVVVASGDAQLNQEVSLLSKYKLINRADYPEEGKLIVISFFLEMFSFLIHPGKKSSHGKELRKFIICSYKKRYSSTGVQISPVVAERKSGYKRNS
jgi:precorrin-2 dehydrogenase/sirohydrochlorin ferrochelatase